jgi:hypothetical protein
MPVINHRDPSSWPIGWSPTQYRVCDDNGLVLFQANDESVLRHILALHPDAIQRIKRELLEQEHGTCELYVNFMGAKKLLVSIV